MSRLWPHHPNPGLANMPTSPTTSPPVPPSIEDLKALRIKLKNVHEEVHENLSRLDRIALWITSPTESQ